MSGKVISLSEAKHGRAPATPLDWCKAAADYRAYRPGYAEDYFLLLQRLGVGGRGQTILDLGTGAGALAIPFARHGAHVTALDRAPGQIASARAQALVEGLNVRFLTVAAEDAVLEDKHYDAVTASMCWRYFDEERVVPKIKAALRPEGLLLISMIAWLSDSDDIVRASEALIAHYSVGFTSPIMSLEPDIEPHWAKDIFKLKTYHREVISLPFTRESWRGRLRASRWIGATLSEKQVEAFDSDLDGLLEEIAPPQFEIKHGVRFQIFQALP